MMHPGPILETLYGGLIGLFIGLALGVIDALASGSRARFAQRSLRGALAGFLGGFIGFPCADQIWVLLGGNPQSSGSSFSAFLVQMLVRAVGWSVLGALLGAIYGALDSSAVKSRNGAIGGALGGFPAGLLFNPLAYIFTDRISRLLGWALLGCLIGFFTALVTVVLREAWVLVVYGRNEGKEIILEKPVSRIGRHELAEIPIFRDRLLAANHAEIRQENGRYVLTDGGSVVGTSVNGQRIAQRVILKDSDLIQVGNTQIVFYERSTAGSTRRHIDLSTAAPAAPPLVAEGLCPYCGQHRDPVTGACACSVSDTAAPPDIQAGFVPLAASSSSAVAGSAAGPRLQGLSGPHAGETFILSGPTVEMGRDQSNAIALTRDTTVSRKHAVLTQIGTEWQIADMGSSNGTFVNGVRVSSQVVRPGDELCLGTARFRLEA
jgi:pSer/pThr/pTyr-binding forkhead associated (FHA) protein